MKLFEPLPMAIGGALASVFGSGPTALILCFTGRMPWAQIWAPLMNGVVGTFVVGYCFGLVWILGGRYLVGTLLVGGTPESRDVQREADVFAYVSMTLGVGCGIAFAILFGGRPIWHWNR